MTNSDKLDLEEIEDRLKDYTYDEIPQKFINTIEDQRTLLTQLQQLCAEELDKLNKRELASATPTEES